MKLSMDDYLQDVLDSMFSFIIVDKDAKVLFLNRNYARELGLTQDEAIGQPIQDLIKNTRLPAVLKSGKSIWSEFMWSESKITGKRTDYPTISNWIVVRRNGDPKGEIVGAISYTSVRWDHNQANIEAELRTLREQNRLYQQRISELQQSSYNLDEILGKSAAIEEIKTLISRIANTSVSVCIIGETGTGKELVANAIHKLSTRSIKPFIKINCAAIPKDLIESELFGYVPGAFTGADRQGKQGLFELANGGTLLLDEIGELPLSLQSKLLRVLQEGEFKRIGGTEIISVDVRILCSTNRNLKNMVSAGEFRPDLYYRINVMEIIVPPLRERIEDISDLANHFIKESNRRNGTVISGMHAGAYQALATYHWPGNVRELEHSIERACILCGAGFLEEHHFSFLRGMQPHNEDLAKPVPRYSLSAKWEDAEAKRILQVLEACGGNRQKAASILQISRTTLFRKMKKYGLQ